MRDRTAPLVSRAGDGVASRSLSLVAPVPGIDPVGPLAFPDGDESLESAPCAYELYVFSIQARAICSGYIHPISTYPDIFGVPGNLVP